MNLIVAEKKSVAVDLAQAIGSGVRSSKGRVTATCNGSDLVIIYPNGHAVRCLFPDEMDERYRKWKLESLPIIPQGYKFEHTANSAQGKICIDLLRAHLKGASQIINACDAGREGELIFKELMDSVEADPYGSRVYRMWITDTTERGLRMAYENRHRADCKKYRNLGLSAEIRKFSDWIYGINGTRYFEISRRQNWEEREIIGIGRVKTPLLNAIDRNCEKQENWEPTPYYQGYVTYRTEGESYEALVLAPESMQFGFSDTSFRDNADLVRYLRKMETTVGLQWSVQDKKKEVQEHYYGPYNLNDVIRSAARILGWHGEHTMKILQKLYERDRAISYPRTESNFFPESMESQISQSMDWLLMNYLIPEFPEMERIEIPMGEVSRWIDDKKAQDHHAIMPIDHPEVLDEFGNLRDEYRLWELIAKRFFMAFLAPAKVIAFSRITMATHYDHTTFKTMMKSAPILEPGYLVVHQIIGGTEYRSEHSLSYRQKRNPLPKPVREARVRSYRTGRRKTNKPELYNDDTLISYMELNKLGTVATRVGIIKELRERGAIERDNQNFYYITDAGKAHLDHIRGQNVMELLDPELTRSWEEHLDKIAAGSRGRLEPELFLDGVSSKIRELGMRLNTDGYIEEVVICPKSGQAMEFGMNGYIFAGWKDMEFPFEYRGRNMTGADWKHVIQSGNKGGGPFTFHSNKKNSDYQAFLVFKRRDHKIEMRFKRRHRSGFSEN